MQTGFTQAAILSRRKKRTKQYTLDAVKYVIMLMLAVFLLFPYVFMLSKSVMNITDANAPYPSLFPTSALRLANYKVIIEYLPYIFNSLLICVINGIFIPLTGLMVAYPFARMTFKGKKVMFSIMMATVLLPGAVLQVPTYILFSYFGLVDKVASQWIGAFWGGGAMNIFLMIQFMRAFPKDYDDAARIDGAGAASIFFKIMMPLCMNVMLFIGVGTVIGRWSDFQGPLIFLTTKSKFTLAVAFYYDFSASGKSALLPHYKMAMAVIMTVLPAILFFIFQKSMIGGLQIGGVKG